MERSDYDWERNDLGVGYSIILTSLQGIQENTSWEISSTRTGITFNFETDAFCSV